MKYLFRKLFRKSRKRRYNPKPGWNQINELQTQIHDLQCQVRSLARSLNRVRVNDVYMDGKDAKKYKDDGFICH